LNVCGVNDLKQTEMRTAEPLVTELSFFEAEIATGTWTDIRNEVFFIKFRQN